MRVVITGSRHWRDRKAILRVLWGLHLAHGDYLALAHGGAFDGADHLTSEICKQNGWPEPRIYRPSREESQKHGRGAPLARNIRMLEDFNPALCIAFRAAGKSNGTDHCTNAAEARGIPVWRIAEVVWPEE